jgi:hypothetical protein
VFGLLFAFACVTVWGVIVEVDAIVRANFLLFSALTFGMCALLAPTITTLQSWSHTAMPPRRQLLRLWLVIRILVFGVVCTMASNLTARGLRDGWTLLVDNPYQQGILVTTIITFPVPLLFTPTFRGRVHRWLGSLGESGSQEQEAAAVASLIGARDLASAVRTGRKEFRVLPLASLAADDLVSNTDTGLNARVRSAALGECDAFISHSWQDDGVKKFMRLQEHEWGTSEPTVWLVRRRLSDPCLC